jgi:hypothetical protein
MVFETFAWRKRLQTRAEKPEIYTYDIAPDQFRHQVCMALSEGIGRYYQGAGISSFGPGEANVWWEQIDRVCRKEIYSYLSYLQERNLDKRIFSFFCKEQGIDDVLSVLEVCCFVLVVINDDSHDTTDARGAKLKSSDAVAEVNAKLEQHGMGYRFEGRHIIRIDSQFIHAEVVSLHSSFYLSPNSRKLMRNSFGHIAIIELLHIRIVLLPRTVHLKVCSRQFATLRIGIMPRETEQQN